MNSEKQMTVKDLIQMLSEFDDDSPVEILAYGESSQGMCSYEIDVDVEESIVILTPGREV